jgi:hypothetical protein
LNEKFEKVRVSFDQVNAVLIANTLKIAKQEMIESIDVMLSLSFKLNRQSQELSSVSDDNMELRVLTQKQNELNKGYLNDLGTIEKLSMQMVTASSEQRRAYQEILTAMDQIDQSIQIVVQNHNDYFESVDKLHLQTGFF